ncbi:unnamed protein product [Hymenolepis diminuta]|uniref:Uncharacterized protein n=1 Tax=Hymenolepis diminuta TaxID=6216 RepID=A0A564YC62_HYMDI|nr:unnamed protein product [Hymenolepis diminuta]
MEEITNSSCITWITISAVFSHQNWRYAIHLGWKMRKARNITDLQVIHNVAVIYKLDPPEPLRKLYGRLNPTLKINPIFALGLPQVFGSNVLVRAGFNVRAG